MAILLQFTVTPATQDQLNELEIKLEESMMKAGGPPPGLMAHVIYPDHGGFVVWDVWRTEPEADSFVGELLRPSLDQLDLPASEITTFPVWSFARP